MKKLFFVLLMLTGVATSVRSQKTFVMCDLMPGAEVAGHSPFTVPFIKAEPWSSVPQGCTYRFNSNNNRDPASIGIVVTDFQTMKEALTSQQNRDQMIRDNWQMEPEKVDSLGDKASLFPGMDEVSLSVVKGNRVLDISFKGQFPDITGAQKKSAAKTLAGLLLARLP